VTVNMSALRPPLDGPRLPAPRLLTAADLGQFMTQLSVKDFLTQVRGYPLLIFFVCLLGWTLTNLDQSLFGYAVPGIRAEFGKDLDDIGWILTFSFILASISAVIMGGLADRYGRKLVFVCTLGASAFLVGLHFWVPDFITLAALRTVGFAVSIGLAPIVVTYTSEAAPARYRGLMTGFLQCGYPIGWFTAAMIAAPIMANYGWRAIFLPALVVVPIAIILSRYLPESRRFEETRQARKEDPHSQDSFVLRVKALLAPNMRKRTIGCFTIFFMSGGAYAGTAYYFPSFFNEVRGYSTETATLVVGVSYGIGIIGYIGSSVVGEFVTTRRNTIVIWTWLGALAMCGLIYIPTSLTGDIVWFSLMAAFFYGSNAVMGTFLTEQFPTHMRATGVAIAGTLGLNAGHIIFPLAVAWAVEPLGWELAFALATVPPLFIGGLVALSMDNVQSGQDIDEALESRT
jgi:MFS family permease